MQVTSDSHTYSKVINHYSTPK